MLRLRPYKAQDAKLIANWISDPVEFSKWCANRLQYPLTEEVLHDLQVKTDATEDSWLFTALDAKGIPTGFFMMSKADYAVGSVHLGFIIIDPGQRGKGYGKEMLQAAIRYAFDILGMDRITLRVFENNEVARTCYAKMGFKEIDFDPDSFSFEPGQPWGCYTMALDR